jgi:hypothetical protein
MPNNEMMKFTHNAGIWLLCGWLPPTGAIAALFMFCAVCRLVE